MSNLALKPSEKGEILAAVAAVVQTTLDNHELGAHITYCCYGPQVMAFQIEVEVPERRMMNTLLDLRKPLTQALAQAARGPHNPRGIPLSDGRVRFGKPTPNTPLTIEIPVPEFSPVTLDDLGVDLSQARGLIVPLGLGVLGMVEPLDLKLPQHILIAGQSQHSGKTTLLAQLIFLVAKMNPPKDGETRVKIALFDGKGGEKLSVFEMLPHLRWRPAFDGEDALRLALAIDQELDRRIANPNEKHEWLIVFIDEAPELISQHELVGRMIERIVEKGAGYNCRVIVSAQYSNSDAFGGSTRILQQLSGKISGRVGNGQAAHQVMGVEGTEAHYLGSNGDRLGYLMTESGSWRLFRFQPPALRQLDLIDLPRRTKAFEPLPDPTQLEEREDKRKRGRKPRDERTMDELYEDVKALRESQHLPWWKIFRELGIGGSTQQKLVEAYPDLRVKASGNGNGGNGHEA